MSRRPSTASPGTEPPYPSDRDRVVIGLVRLALLLLGAAMLGYVLYLYFVGIYPRIPDSVFRILLPSLFAVAAAGLLFAALREVKRLRRSGRERGRS